MVCLALVVLAVGVRLLYGANIRDDAYITLRYASNLASGVGFVFNLGERVLGTTTPLFTLILATLAKAGFDLVEAATALGIMSDAAGTVLAFSLARQRGRWYPAVAASIAYALFSPLISHAVSGMETSLYVALILGAVLAYAHGKLTTTAALASLVTFVRPDGVILALALACHYAWTQRSFKLKPVVVFTAMLLPWVVFSTVYFGSPVPNSVVAKLNYVTDDPFLSIRHLFQYFLQPGDQWLLVAVFFSLFGLRSLWQLGKGQQALLVWAAIYTVLFSASNKFLYPDYPFEWYFVPLLAPLALGAASGLDRLSRGMSKRIPSIRLQIAVAILVAFVAFYGTVAYKQGLALRLYVDGREGIYKGIAAQLARYGTTEVVAAPEIGTLGYYYPGPFLDLDSLVSPEVIALGYEGAILKYRPAWLVSWDTLVPEGLRTSPWFASNYRPVLVRQNWEGRNAILYRRYPQDRPVISRRLTLGGFLQLNQAVAESPPTVDGNLVRLRLDWVLSRPVDRRFTLFVHLLDATGNLLSQQDNEPQEGTSPLDGLRPGHFADLYDLLVPSGTDLATVRLRMGGYSADDPQQRLSWVTEGGSDLGQEVDLPLFPRNAEDIMPKENFRGCQAEFGDSIALRGYTLHRTAQQDWSLSLIWTSSNPIGSDYTVFVHALDRQGRMLGQSDSQPQEGNYPTSAWLPNELVMDNRTLPASPQDATIFEVGLYRHADGRRLPLKAPFTADGLRIDPAAPGC